MSSLAPAFNAPLETSDRGNTGIPVFNQDQTTQSLSLTLTRDLDTVTLDGNAVRDEYFFDVIGGDGAKIPIGSIMEFGADSVFMRARVLDVDTDRIELDTQINHTYLDGATVTVKSDNLRVNGTDTPVVFDISPEEGQVGDFTRIIVLMEGTVDMDSGTFGTLAALRRGLVMRTVEENGDYTNIMNFKTNGELISECFDNNFLPNNGQGIRMFVARLTWAGASKHGVVQRADGALAEKYEAVVQDDLTGVTFTKLSLILQGHEVQQ